MNEILNINNVHGYLDKETGTAYLNAEDVARGLGFTTVAKSGNEVVRWARVNTYPRAQVTIRRCHHGQRKKVDLREGIRGDP